MSSVYYLYMAEALYHCFIDFGSKEDLQKDLSDISCFASRIRRRVEIKTSRPFEPNTNDECLKLYYDQRQVSSVRNFSTYPTELIPIFLEAVVQNDIPDEFIESSTKQKQ
ncbi:hypothetical protein T4E_3850 [Trichinella pseudospiralis]|uniref:Uncharacterized protein n=1 Tax=Trichinella pseudospiralis TaxID=6337 RepID=A0A0V0YD77_TRIPS|nr:hypothetical protein T4E_3850 [Trichinella pseudospiralis]